MELVIANFGFAAVVGIFLIGCSATSIHYDGECYVESFNLANFTVWEKQTCDIPTGQSEDGVRRPLDGPAGPKHLSEMKDDQPSH